MGYRKYGEDGTLGYGDHLTRDVTGISKQFKL
jgi:hypothetical protein